MSPDRHVPSRRTVLIALALVGASSVPLSGPASAAGPAHTAHRPSTAAGVPSPMVTGPVPNTTSIGDPAHGYPFLATDVDLAAAGYVEQEFFISGAATR